MKASALLKAFLLSALLLGLIEAAPFHGGCGCPSPCGCAGPKYSMATVPIQLSLPAPAPSCGCGVPVCGGGCGIPAPAPACGCGSPCGGACGLNRHQGLLGLHGPGCGCGPKFMEVTKCKKFLVPCPKPKCRKCLVPACICDVPAPVPACGC